MTRTIKLILTIAIVLALAGHAYAVRRGTLLGMMLGAKQNATPPSAPSCTNCTAPQLCMIARNGLFDGAAFIADDIYFDAGCSNLYSPDSQFCGNYPENWLWESPSTFIQFQLGYCDLTYKANLGGMMFTNGFTSAYGISCASGVFTGSYHLVDIFDGGDAFITNSVDIQFASAADITNNCIACVGGVQQGTVTTTGFGELPCAEAFVSPGCSGMDWVWNGDYTLTLHRTPTNTWKITSGCFEGGRIETNSLCCISGVITGTVVDGGHTYTFNPP